MTYKTLKWLTILLAPLIIGGFEFLRHGLLLGYIPMEVGNYYITILTFILSYFFANWMFHTIKSMNLRLVEEQARMAVYEERERLARELHDSIAQTLFYLNVKLKQGKIEEAHAAVSDIDHQVRQAIFNLRSLPQGDHSLNQKLRTWLNEWSILSGIDNVADIDIPEGYFSAGEEVQLFGIIQEAFTNIRKHSKARRTNISITAFPEGWRLWIADDGIGIADDRMQIKNYGLSMMRERATKLGASFDVRVREIGGLEIILLRSKIGTSFRSHKRPVSQLEKLNTQISASKKEVI